MDWFDGTLNYGEEKIRKEFPVKIADDLRVSGDGKRIAIINRFEYGTELSDLADPKADEGNPDHEFYHVFTGKDADTARRAIEDFVSHNTDDDGESITLLRADPDRTFMYSYGHICTKLLNEQEKLRTLVTGVSADENIFVLPLKRYMFKCPVCGKRTLQYRGVNDICTECGWEDEGSDDEDEETGANGDYTIRTYRKKYLELKANDPGYTWWSQFKHNDNN